MNTYYVEAKLADGQVAAGTVVAESEAEARAIMQAEIGYLGTVLSVAPHAAHILEHLDVSNATMH